MTARGRRPPEKRHAAVVASGGTKTSRRWVVAAAAYSLFLATLLVPLLSHQAEPRWDARDQFYPAFTYVADSIREGRFPLWDPFTNCGFPFHAEPDFPTLNPLAIILGSVVHDTGTGFVAFWAIQWWLGGIGMIWLAWHFGSRPSGGFVAAAVYTLSGFFVGHAQHTPYISIAAWLPWIFGLADRAVATSRFGFALLGGAAMGMASLGGYPGLLTFAGLALALWLSLRFLLPGADGDRPLSNRACRVAGTLCIVGSVAVAVWSPVLHAFFTEGAGYTDRVSPVPPDVANFVDPFSPMAFFSIFFPYASLLGRSLMQADLSMANGYVGCLAVPLAAYWFLKGTGKQRPRWFLIFFLFMFLVSLGGKAGVRTALYYLFPPMQYMRFSAAFRLFWIFALSLAGGLGFSLLKERPETSRHALYPFLGWAGAALLSALVLVRVFSSRGIAVGDAFPRLFMPAMAIFPIGIVILYFMSASRSARMRTFGPAVLLLLAAADMGAHLYNNRESVWIARDSIRQAEAFHRRTTGVSGEPGPRRPPLPFGFFNAQQVVKEPVVQGYTTMKSRGFDEILCRSRFVEVMQSPRRFWLSPGAETVFSVEDALSTLAVTGAGNPVPAYVTGVAPPGLSRGRTVPGSYGRTNVVYYSPERVEIEVDVPSGSGAFLASTERYATGWTARLDGIPQVVYQTNLYFRGLLVPPGPHHIVWTYEPRLWSALVWLGYAVLVSATAGGVMQISRSAGLPAETEEEPLPIS